MCYGSTFFTSIYLLIIYFVMVTVRQIVEMSGEFIDIWKGFWKYEGGLIRFAST